jgi:IS605 OrfB family transposase
MRKTFKYRLFPTAAQRAALEAQLDRCRWVYNHTLEVRREAWGERQESLSRYDTNRLLTEWRAANRRGNFTHQESRKLVNRFGLIVFENLDIRDMQSNGNRAINRGIADVAWGRFVQYTRFKAEEAGRVCLLVDPRGTTQECSGCGNTVPKDLSVRVHDCPYCGLRLDRDLNASLNVLGRGLASLGNSPGSSPF